MRVCAVDDEAPALAGLTDAIRQALPGAEIHGFQSAEEALGAAARTEFEVAFLDIEMRGMNGIELAKQLKSQFPNINIIFSTGYSSYTGDAIALHASGYIMKPVTAAQIKTELADLRHPLAAERSTGVQVQCFGNFEVFVDGEPAKFQYSKAKELFAYLIDRRGALCTNSELMAVLWEDEIKDSYYKNIRVDLLKALPERLFAKQWGKLGVITSEVACDYYDWIAGKPAAINAFHGEYMTQYSWSEMTLSSLSEL